MIILPTATPSDDADVFLVVDAIAMQMMKRSSGGLELLKKPSFGCGNASRSYRAGVVISH
jgi:hypothetical protein